MFLKLNFLSDITSCYILLCFVLACFSHPCYLCINLIFLVTFIFNTCQMNSSVVYFEEIVGVSCKSEKGGESMAGNRF